jgi:hypothetical protein
MTVRSRHGEPLLTPREVAEFLSASPETVLRRHRSGELPGFRIASNALRFDPTKFGRDSTGHAPKGLLSGFANDVRQLLSLDKSHTRTCDQRPTRTSEAGSPWRATSD